MPPRFRIAAIGELLWDLLPDGARLGGAPANFAATSVRVGQEHSMSADGAEVFLVSRVGDDERGREARMQMAAHGVSVEHVSIDPDLPTGTVAVTIDPERGPMYSIHAPAAWDAIPQTQELSALAGTLDAVCFGTLAQRSEVTQATLRGFVEATSKDCVRVFDVNLRTPFWSAGELEWGCNQTTVLKMNREEVPLVADVLRAPVHTPVELAKFLLQKFPLEMVAITRGSNGSLLATRKGIHEHPGVPVELVDAVGAGDAFTAALLYGFLCRLPLGGIAEEANRWGARMAAERGGMPSVEDDCAGR